MQKNCKTERVKGKESLFENRSLRPIENALLPTFTTETLAPSVLGNFQHYYLSGKLGVDIVDTNFTILFVVFVRI